MDARTQGGPMPNNNDNSKGQKPPKRKARLWLWFIVGFFVVFIGMSFTVTIYSMHPSGNAVIGCKLWQYYVIQMQRALSVNKTVGPAGDSSALVTTAFQHLLCSAAGGAVMLGIGWVVGKVRDRRA
jgi:hypothetical protein